MVDQGTGSEVPWNGEVFFLSFRGIDSLALAGSFWRRRTPSLASRPLRFTPQAGVTIPLTLLAKFAGKCPSVLLLKFTVQTWGEPGFPYVQLALMTLRSVYRGQIPTIVTHTQKRWFAVGKLVINAGRTAPGASLSRPMNPDQKRCDGLSILPVTKTLTRARQTGAPSLIGVALLLRSLFRLNGAGLL